MKELTLTVEPHYTLREAVERFFPGGCITVRSLRTEIRKGRLRVTEVAGKFLVSESAIAEMLEFLFSMPRSRKAPRLELRRSRTDRSAKWYIRDGENRVSTGCGGTDIRRAQKALADYIAAKWAPPGALPPSELFVDEVITTYLKEHAEHSQSRDFLFHTARPLFEWWSGKTLAEVNEPNCHAYVRWRTGAAMAHEQLEAH